MSGILHLAIPAGVLHEYSWLHPRKFRKGPLG